MSKMPKMHNKHNKHNKHKDKSIQSSSINSNIDSNNDKNSHNSSDEWEIDNLPNRLTLFRVALIPIIIGSLSPLYYSQHKLSYELMLNYLAASAFGVAAITDFIDGYIARSRNLVTNFGSFLDPLADKFLVVSSLIMLLALDRLNVFVVIILVLREMYITALRLLALEKKIKVPVGIIGKIKTSLQMVGIPLLLVNDIIFGIELASLGEAFIYLACFASLVSATQYSLKLIQKIKSHRQIQKG